MSDADSSSQNISFRLPKAQLDQLREEARQKRISLNTLANQIVDSYVNFISNLSNADLLPVSRQVLASLLEGYDEEEIKTKVTQNIKQIGKDITLQLRGKYDFETLVDIFDSWLLVTGFPYRHDREFEKKKNSSNNNNRERHNFIIQHNMGRKYSVFAAEGLMTYFQPLATKQVEYSITDNSISITVEG